MNKNVTVIRVILTHLQNMCDTQTAFGNIWQPIRDKKSLFSYALNYMCFEKIYENKSLLRFSLNL